MQLQYFFSQLINGLGIGSIYALVALGYSMVYGIVKLINFAHGDIIMVGAYTLFIIFKKLGAPVGIAMILVVFVCALAGIIIQRTAYQRLLKQGAPKISLLITALGVSMFLQNLAQLIFGSQKQPIPKLIDVPNISFGGLSLEFSRVLNIGVMIMMMIALTSLVSKSRMGKAMRATSEDSGAAMLMGINVNQVVAFTFAIGSALAGVAAILYVNTYPGATSPVMGSMLGLKAFVAAVVGGIGSIPGAAVGGILLGVAEAMTVAYGNDSYTDAVVFGVLIVVLLVKPTGLFGKNIREKV